MKVLLEDKNTLFDDLIKNLENNSKLYECLYNILICGLPISYNINNPVIDLGHMFGYLIKDENNNIVVSNQIFKEVIYNYMISKIRTSAKNMSLYNVKSSFLKENGELNIEKVLNRFQQFMKEQYSQKDLEFLKNHGRLLFLAFIKPIINGIGFDFKEVQVSEEKRLDVVIIYNNFKYIIEMKIWRGPKYHEDGVKQLCDYLDIHGLDKGYLVIFNFNKNKEFKEERISSEGKELFGVYV